MTLVTTHHTETVACPCRANARPTHEADAALSPGSGVLPERSRVLAGRTSQRLVREHASHLSVAAGCPEREQEPEPTGSEVLDPPPKTSFLQPSVLAIPTDTRCPTLQTPPGPALPGSTSTPQGCEPSGRVVSAEVSPGGGAGAQGRPDAPVGVPASKAAGGRLQEDQTPRFLHVEAKNVTGKRSHIPVDTPSLSRLCHEV